MKIPLPGNNWYSNQRRIRKNNGEVMGFDDVFAYQIYFNKHRNNIPPESILDIRIWEADNGYICYFGVKEYCNPHRFNDDKEQCFGGKQDRCQHRHNLMEELK
ncbi:MAG: hypothetical protein ACFFG0_03270 [Candidatus Thorarchaeota archaeon]